MDKSKVKKVFMQTTENSFDQCPVKKALDLIGSKWRLLLVHHIRDNTIRYGELKRAIPDISEKMLIQELKYLSANGLVSRISYSEVPPRVEYCLTEKGKTLLPLIEQLERFGSSLL